MMHFFCRRKDLTAHWVHMRGFLVPTHLEKTALWVLPTLQTKKLQVRSCPPFSKVTLPEPLPKKWVWVTSHWTKTPKVPRKEVWPSVEAAPLSQRLWTTIKPRYFFFDQTIKVSKFQKQIFLFWFEPKDEREIIFWILPWSWIDLNYYCS